MAEVLLELPLYLRAKERLLQFSKISVVQSVRAWDPQGLGCGGIYSFPPWGLNPSDEVWSTGRRCASKRGQLA